MATETPLENVPVKKIESTRRITCECPYGGPNYLDLHRETALLDADDKVVSFEPDWRHIHLAAADVAPMTFTRPDGSTFTGVALMTDMQIACDQLAASPQEENEA